MTNIPQQHINLLGFKCKDKVTGLTGVITSMAFDLYGCIQAIVHPGLDKTGETLDTLWFDIARLEITSKKPVMNVPNFKQGYIAEGLKGPADKPTARKN